MRVVNVITFEVETFLYFVQDEIAHTSKNKLWKVRNRLVHRPWPFEIEAGVVFAGKSIDGPRMDMEHNHRGEVVVVHIRTNVEF